MNVAKKMVLLLSAILFACVAGYFGAACSKPETNWATYHNPKYGYTIDYPRDWDLDTIDAPDIVLIFSSSFPFVRGTVGIVAGVGAPPLEEMVMRVKDTLAEREDTEDFKIISSHSLDGKFRWLVEYTFTSEGSSFVCETYLGEPLDSDYQFVVDWHSEVSSASTCKEIVEKFVAH